MLGALASPAALSLSQQLGGLPQAVMAAQAPGVITGTQTGQCRECEREREGGMEGEIERGLGRGDEEEETQIAPLPPCQTPAERRPP